ncbi:tyrosine-type recombinase/integrase [Spirosoma litoris]
MFIKMRTRFWFRKQQTKQTTSQQGIIYFTVTINKIRSQPLSTGIQVIKSDWDSKKQLIVGPTAPALNEELISVKNTLIEIKNNLKATRQDVTAEAIRVEWLREQSGPISLAKIAKQHTEYQEKFGRNRKGKKLSEGTFETYRTYLAYLNDYLKNNKVSENPEQINATWLQGYETYFANRSIKPLKQKSINLGIGYIKQILRFAMANELITKAPALYYKIKPALAPKPQPLSASECKKLESATFPDPQQRAVDCFLFLRYTGLHFVDGKNITPDALQIDTDEIDYLYVLRQKTEEAAYIPYHAKASLLVAKYGGLDRLPFTNYEALTKQLRKAAKSVDITKKITFGMARDTFADDCSNNMKMSDENLAGMLGHTTTSQVKKYRKFSIRRIAGEWKEGK